MRKKIFGLGNEFCKNTKKISFYGKNSGFALVFAVFVLLTVSALPCAFCVLEKAKLQNIERKSLKFYENLEKQNEEVLKNWKNLGEKSEID